MPQRQIKLGDEAAGAEAGRLFAQRDDPGFESGAGLVRAGLGGAGLAFETGVALGLGAAQPLADGVARTAELAGGGLDPVDAGVGDELVAEGEMRIVSAEHGVIGLGGGRRRDRHVKHALVSPGVKPRCPLFSIFWVRTFSRAPALRPPFPPCMCLSIFLVWLQAKREDGATLPPAGGKVAARARTFSPGRGGGSTHRRLRPPARPVRASWSKLEPLLERFGLQPSRLVFKQV